MDRPSPNPRRVWIVSLELEMMNTRPSFVRVGSIDSTPSARPSAYPRPTRFARRTP
jgi:hypothetical protein